MSKSDPLTLDEVYHRVKKLTDEIRPVQIEIKKLVDQAEWYWLNKE